MALYKGSEPVAGLAKNTIVTGFNIFDCKWSDHIINDIQWLRADSFSWQSGDVYTTAYNKLVDEYATGTEETADDGIVFKKTESGFKITTPNQEQKVLDRYNGIGISSKHSDGWFYILDTVNKRFKLPRTKWGFKGLRTDVGYGIAESLPNIKGDVGANWGIGHVPNVSLGIGVQNTSLSGVFYGNSDATVAGCNGAGYSGKSLGFDASLSSSTYQDNAPVQERATQMYLYFYVGEYAREAIEQTAGITSEQLNGKLDISTYNNNPRTNAVYLKTTYVNGTSGYNIWSNGFCEQWGVATHPKVSANSGATNLISFLKTFKDTNYNFLIAMKTDAGNTSGLRQYSTTVDTGSIAVHWWSTAALANTGTYYWRACGYLAEGEY